MGSNNADKMSTGNDVEASETTIEIKIKTLDSQTYSLRVDKQMPVPALKDQIASVTGVLSDQQRLICRGRVLKDDQLLSAYHVEDGHTLHLVVRQPPVSIGLPDHPARDPASSTSGHQGRQVTPNFVIETFNMPDQVDGVSPEINRIVSAVLGSFGIPNIGSGGEGVDVREHGSRRVERTFGQSDRAHSAFGLPPAVSMGSMQPPVIPDSMTTLSQYQSCLSREFDAIGRDAGNNTQATMTEERESNSSPLSGTVQGLPTPASLAAVMLSTRQMLVEQVRESLHQLARQLENQANVTDPSLRSSIQSSAWRSGILLHNLGAYLLELGRATMTLRLGQTPSEAVVNAGPAVFISPSGPSPLMVQPFPFQPGANFGAIPMGTMQSTSGLVNGIGLPRIDIQIRRGSSTAAPNADTQQPSGQANTGTNSAENVVNQATPGGPGGPSSAGEPGVRIVPIRTVVAAIPSSFSHVHSESSGNSTGLYYPVLGRVQHVASGHAGGEHQPIAIQTERHIISEYTVQQNIEVPAGDGSLPTIGPQEPSRPQSVNINIVSAGGTHDNQETDGQVPSRIMHFLRTFFPGGEQQAGDAVSHGPATDSVTQHVETSHGAVSAPEVERRASDEEIFISNMLRQIMPSISQLAGTSSNVAPAGEANASEQRTAPDSSTTEAENSDFGTSRRQSDIDPNAPNPKRQKME